MEDWKIEIIKANNGYILTYMEDMEVMEESTIRKIVFEEKENNLQAIAQDVLTIQYKELIKQKIEVTI